MSKKRDTQPIEENYTKKTYAYIAIALAALSAVALGLSFTALGIYSLIASILLALASLAFVNVQKRKNKFRNLIFIETAAYIVLAAAVAIFIGGIVWSAVGN